MADTKFEFGLLDGEVVQIDEALTPDSSRFWPVDGYQPGASRRRSISSRSETTWTRRAGTSARRRRRSPTP